MPHLEAISLVQFRNYNHRQFRFDRRIVCITGNNGVGKTNLLDAVYYLCFAKSYFFSQETRNVRYGADGFRLEGTLRQGDRLDTVVCTYKGGKKEVSLNGNPYTRFSRHLGRFPAVIVAPDDAVVISGGSGERRRYLDTLLSQLDTDYLDDLITYQKVLTQRNGLLKSQGEGSPADETLLGVFDAQLSAPGSRIYRKRLNFMAAVTEKVRHYYQLIAGSDEDVSIDYQSALAEAPMEELLARGRQRDLFLKRTSQGVHRDELEFSLDGHPLRQVGSQGQRKNFLFALKLAQYDILREFKGFPPLLLLDDVFEKLDHQRISRLIALIATDDFGQVFITDTDAARLVGTFPGASSQLQLIEL